MTSSGGVTCSQPWSLAWLCSLRRSGDSTGQDMELNENSNGGSTQLVRGTRTGRGPRRPRVTKTSPRWTERKPLPSRMPLGTPVQSLWPGKGFVRMMELGSTQEGMGFRGQPSQGSGPTTSRWCSVSCTSTGGVWRLYRGSLSHGGHPL